MNSKKAIITGRIASLMAVLMYVSYFPQIMNNLNGNYGNPMQPLVACINCCFWCAYSVLQERKDWPLFVANIPGILFGLVAFLTSLH